MESGRTGLGFPLLGFREGSVGFRGSLLWVPLSEGSLGVRLVHQHKGGGGVNSPSAESGAGGRDEEIMSLCGGTPARPVNPISGFPLYLLLYGIICSQQERGLPPWCLLLMGLELASDWGGEIDAEGLESSSSGCQGRPGMCGAAAWLRSLPSLPVPLRSCRDSCHLCCGRCVK